MRVIANSEAKLQKKFMYVEFPEGTLMLALRFTSESASDIRLGLYGQMIKPALQKLPRSNNRGIGTSVDIGKRRFTVTGITVSVARTFAKQVQKRGSFIARSCRSVPKRVCGDKCR
jgi:hypothetical protein